MACHDSGLQQLAALSPAPPAVPSRSKFRRMLLVGVPVSIAMWVVLIAFALKLYAAL